MLILSINSGSSSIKYTLIDIVKEQTLLRGIVENIGSDDSSLKQCFGEKEIVRKEIFQNHEQAIQRIIIMLTDPHYGAVRDLSEIAAVGHRVAHGGETLYAPLVIDEEAFSRMRENTKLAPLHMPHMLLGIEMFQKLLPGKPMVAVFDTAFHQSMPREAYLYAIPYEYYIKHGIRRYGFHGTSHKYVSARAAQFLGKPLETLKLITCHLGNGSSVAAVKYSRSIDTSMGFTPLSGVPMGTRCGDIDPAIVGVLMENEALTYAQVEKILTGRSGFLGLTGKTNDCREIERLIKDGDERAEIAADVFCYQVKKFIGAYAAAMNGVDCVVFTGGIGENAVLIREKICNKMDYLGLRLDPQKNLKPLQNGADAMRISRDDAAVQVCVVKTNEELMIGRETFEAIRRSD